MCRVDRVPIETDIIIVAASLVALFALASCVAAWAEGRWPVIAIGVLVAALAGLGMVHVALRDGELTLWAIPDAFINVVAMLL